MQEKMVELLTVFAFWIAARLGELSDYLIQKGLESPSPKPKKRKGGKRAKREKAHTDTTPRLPNKRVSPLSGK